MYRVGRRNKPPPKTKETNTMKITATLAKQILEAGLTGKNKQSINEVGGTIRCKDFAGKWFDLEWFHGNNVVTIANLQDSPNIWIGASEDNEVTL